MSKHNKMSVSDKLHCEEKIRIIATIRDLSESNIQQQGHSVRAPWTHRLDAGCTTSRLAEKSGREKPVCVTERDG